MGLEFVTRAQTLALPGLRAQDVITANPVKKEIWYQKTEEYNEWRYTDTSAFLWFRDHSGTSTTAEFMEILRHLDEHESDLVDTVAYFCPKKTSRPVAILRSIIIQLGRSSQSRVELLDDAQKSEMLSLLEPESFTGKSIEVLWDLLQSLLQPCSNRKVCLMLDGIDALHTEDLRGFARRLHRISSTARSESDTRSTGDFWSKFLITSRPNVQLAEIFRNEMFIDPDTEISGP